jgi:hypothetical protein
MWTGRAAAAPLSANKTAKAAKKIRMNTLPRR